MIPSPYRHLDEISKILSNAILRIEATNSEQDQKNDAESENPLDLPQKLSVSVSPSKRLNPRKGEKLWQPWLNKY